MEVRTKKYKDTPLNRKLKRVGKTYKAKLFTSTTSRKSKSKKGGLMGTSQRSRGGAMLQSQGGFLGILATILGDLAVTGVKKLLSKTKFGRKLGFGSINGGAIMPMLTTKSDIYRLLARKLSASEGKKLLSEVKKLPEIQGGAAFKTYIDKKKTQIKKLVKKLRGSGMVTSNFLQ